ncbi:protein LIFEGUARD 4-like [Malania oleifera]|uniref:protein LIFEGUARD 4-like n=1 Tax=Malania oleifera TaxID=397392 RepID=UPI0025ADF9DE|nr:protein LIFEGUARD 4-like [Malania oleifera]
MYPKVGDLEAGNNGHFYPTMLENPQFWWPFFRKLYTILPVLFLFTLGFTAGVAFNSRMQPVFGFTKPGLFIYYAVIAFIWEIVVLAAILTSVAAVSLTLFTFCGARRGLDFSFLEPFLYCAFTILMVSALVQEKGNEHGGGWMQVFYWMEELGQTCYEAAGAINFSGYLIYVTDNLIKRFDYDHCVTLYTDIINIFSMLLTMLRN